MNILCNFHSVEHDQKENLGEINEWFGGEECTKLWHCQDKKDTQSDKNILKSSFKNGTMYAN